MLAKTERRNSSMNKKTWVIIVFGIAEVGFLILVFRLAELFIESNPSANMKGLMSFVFTLGIPSITLGLIYLMQKIGKIEGTIWQK
jgi:hypothetical protein